MRCESAENCISYDPIVNNPMDHIMKQILLATALIALPVAAFTAFQMFTPQP